MCSVIDDRTLRARLRDAAIEIVAARGVDALTARTVAQATGVSAGSVINHFGSMAGLRQACDEYVAAEIRREKHKAMAAGTDLDVIGALREVQVAPLVGYLAAVLSEDSPAVARLVDELVDDAVGYMEQGVAAGLLEPAADERARAVVLMAWNLGALVMNRHIHRLLGVDLTAATGTELAPYVAPVMELYSKGLFTEAFRQRSATAFEHAATPDARRGREGS
ncbi:MAG: TetR family transcriptional regulator [Candidatus Nanopelagicales bacterium]